MERQADLRRAEARGLVLLPVDRFGRVEREGRLLRFDPALDWITRGKQVLAILRELDARGDTDFPGSPNFLSSRT